jgi:hypothetical protein
MMAASSTKKSTEKPLQSIPLKTKGNGAMGKGAGFPRFGRWHLWPDAEIGAEFCRQLQVLREREDRGVLTPVADL